MALDAVIMTIDRINNDLLLMTETSPTVTIRKNVNQAQYNAVINEAFDLLNCSELFTANAGKIFPNESSARKQRKRLSFIKFFLGKLSLRTSPVY